MDQIKISDLKISFKTKEGLIQTLKNISFTIGKGEIVGLVGESGSGKSITSLAIMQLLENNVVIEGGIYFNETNLLNLNEEQFQHYRGNKIGMIFQEPMSSLNPVLKCGIQITETIIRHQKLTFKQAKQMAISLLEEVKIPNPEESFQKYPFEMSGGQKQRVMIAIALACNPTLLIADEPTTALDVTVQKSILELLLKLRKQRNMSILFISHDLGVISEIADKVIVLYKGNIVEQGNAEEIFINPQHPYTKALLACKPSSKHSLSKLPVMQDFVQQDGIEMVSTNQTVKNLQKILAIDEDEVFKKREMLYAQKPILQVENLEITYTQKKSWFKNEKQLFKAVNGVSFKVYPGETLGLVGESGCGKTSLSRALLRLIEPANGKIVFCDTDITHIEESEMRKFRKDIQIIFQDPYASLNPSFTIGETLIEPLKVHRVFKSHQESKKFVLEIMQKVGLTENQYDRYAHEFSGGQRQRIVIARALVLQPKLIICDESVSALDVSIQAQVLNLLKDLQLQFNLTYIFISHDIAVVKHISDRMMVMNKGEIVEIGYPEDIYLHPKMQYTQQLINAIPKIKYLEFS